MIRHRLLSFVMLLPLWAALSGTALAQNPTNGKTLYDTFCSGCHGTNPATNKDNVLNGKTYSGLVTAWTIFKTEMPYLFPSKVFTDAEMDDIAAYLASKAGGGGTVQFSTSPSSQNFGSFAVGAQSSGITFTVSNIGTASGTITAINNTNAAEFPITGGTCTATPKTVANGASCTIVVAFKPSTTGARSSSVTISSSGIVSPLSLTLSGTGSGGAAPGQLSVSGSLGFGTQPVNVQSSAMTLSIANVGGSAVAMSGVTSNNPGEFPVTVNSCTGSIAAGNGCVVSVAFKPAAAGARNASLTVTSTGTGSPQTVALSGTGQAAATPGQLGLPGSVAFGAQGIGSPAGQNVTVTNIGGAAVTVNSVSSNVPGEFSIGGNSCVGSIAAGMSCGFTVTFTPAAAGSRGATITVVSTGTGSPQFIAASGTGTAVAPPPGQKVAVIEYYHASFNHYFVTAIPDEITKLDNGTFVGWARTGKSFNVYSAATGSTSPVCRFFSTSFAPKSSHFYTPNVAECGGLKSSPDWQFEAEVFHMITSPLGTCPSGTIPVYRLYNNGEGGAPNHRYTIEPQTKALMMNLAWVPEGNGNDVVFMCSPL